MAIARRSLFCSVVLTIALLPATHSVRAQSDDYLCLLQIQEYDQPSAWAKIADYFSSLLPLQASSSTSDLIQLRLELIDLQLQKSRLIEILELHLGGGAEGEVVQTDLSARDIPEIISRTTRILNELRRLARAGDMFAAQEAFDQILATLEARKAVTLCELAAQAEGPAFDVGELVASIRQLQDELDAIGEAEAALAEYIRQK